MLQTLRQVYGEEDVKQIFSLLPYSGDQELHQADSALYRNHATFRHTVNQCLADADYPVLYGHIPVWVLEDLWPGVPRITCVRKPVNQVLSRVFHWRKENIEGARNTPPRELALSPVFRNNQSLYTGDSLRNFTHVGILEQYNDFLYELARDFHWGDVTPLHDHPTNYDNDLRTEVENDIEFLSLLERANYRDMALYDWATEQWRERGLGTV